jgi:hypothetical protein
MFGIIESMRASISDDLNAIKGGEEHRRFCRCFGDKSDICENKAKLFRHESS